MRMQAHGSLVMCRYSIYGPYKDHYACFSCRKSFKQAARSRLQLAADEPAPAIKCPQCAEPMAGMGLDFKAPKKGAIDQWKKVELLFQNGFTFYSCGCCGPGFRPAELAEVQAFIEENRPKSEGEVLLAKIQSRLAGREVRWASGS